MKVRCAVAAVVVLLLTTNLSGQAQQMQAKGFSADKTYQTNNLDHINLFNGNLNVVMPIGQTFPVAGTLSYGLTLAYSGNNWEFYERVVSEPPDYEEFIYWHAAPRDVGNAGIGWWLSLGGQLKYDRAGSLCYYGPDGSQHRWGAQLHLGSGEPGGAYTNDGTYLRLRLIRDINGTVTSRDVEFPDGTRQRFHPTQNQLQRILDRYGNYVEITYGSTASGPQWIIRDSQLRQHTVDFITMSYTPDPAQQYDPYVFTLVKKITLAAFNGQSAVYTFNYLNGDTAPSGISRQFVGNQDCAVGPGSRVPVLTSVTLPDNTTLVMTHDRGDGGTKFATTGPPNSACGGSITSFSGHLTRVGLPTKGAIEWDYHVYSALPQGALGSFEPANSSVGVRERREIDQQAILPPYGGVVSKRTYASVDVATKITTETAITTVTSWTGFDAAGGGGTPFSRTLNYFALSRNKADSLHLIGESGLPYTRVTTDPDPEVANRVVTPDIDPLTGKRRFLSTKTLDATGRILQITYVSYEADDGTMSWGELGNRRLNSRKTVHRDLNGAHSDWSTTDYEDFDGFGHYRRVISNGDLPGQSRTVTTKYNQPDPYTDPAAQNRGTYPGSFQQLGPDEPWVLNTYASQDVLDGGATAKVLTCFDRVTGVLLRRRAMLGMSPAANDLITRFTVTSGNVASEEYSGGDTASLSLSPLCGLNPNPGYRINHTYSGGALSRSQYGVGILVFLDRDIDLNTALTRTSRDANGVATMYSYDVLGRVTSVSPTGIAATTYSYTPQATGGFRASSTQRATNGETISSDTYLDGLGRPIRELIPVRGGQIQRDTAYNQLGWSDRIVENGGITVFGAYDPYGRPWAITAPDNSRTDLTYTGRKSMTRSISVATNVGAASTTLSPSLTSELYDRHGRLYRDRAWEQQRHDLRLRHRKQIE